MWFIWLEGLLSDLWNKHPSWETLKIRFHCFTKYPTGILTRTCTFSHMHSHPHIKDHVWTVTRDQMHFIYMQIHGSLTANQYMGCFGMHIHPHSPFCPSRPACVRFCIGGWDRHWDILSSLCSTAALTRSPGDSRPAHRCTQKQAAPQQRQSKGKTIEDNYIGAVHAVLHINVLWTSALISVICICMGNI